MTKGHPHCITDDMGILDIHEINIYAVVFVVPEE